MGVLFFLIFNVGGAFLAATLAKKKGKSVVKWAIGTFIFPPVVLVLLFKKEDTLYKPGGAHYVRITDEAFEKAKSEFANSPSSVREHYSKHAADPNLTQYEAHDFPVTEMLGVFQGAHYFQEEKMGIPEDLRIGNIQIGRKDQLDLQKCVERWKDKLPGNEKGLVKGVILGSMRDATNESIGMSLVTGAVKGIAKGVVRVATGKSEDVRIFEKLFGNYICGNSPKAKEYLLNHAKRLGGLDEGLCAVAETVMGQFWLVEIAKSNRGFISPASQQSSASPALSSISDNFKKV